MLIVRRGGDSVSDSYDFAKGFNFTGIENIKDILEDGEDFVD